MYHNKDINTKVDTHHSTVMIGLVLLVMYITMYYVYVRAVPEIILGVGGGTVFFRPLHPPGQTWSQSPPTPRTRKCFN